jgi:excisionase family DNA binding protein
MDTTKNNQPLPALISVEEAAKLLGLKRASAYRYAAAGQLPVKRYGRRVYVVRAKLADILPPDGEAAA